MWKRKQKIQCIHLLLIDMNRFNIKLILSHTFWGIIYNEENSKNILSFFIIFIIIMEY